MRAYFYAPRFTRLAWQQKQAENLVSGFLSGKGAANTVLVSYLVNALGQHDPTLLDGLEARIRIKREDLERGRKT